MEKRITIYTEWSGGAWEASWYSEGRTFRFRDSDEEDAIIAAVKATGYRRVECKIVRVK